jgi:hypothetical protein
MRVPAVQLQIHFNVARQGWGAAKLNDCTMKIRSAFSIQKTGMQNANGPTIECFQSIAPQTLMLPDGLEQRFGRNFVGFAEQQNASAVQSPLRVGIVGNRKHLAAFCAVCVGRSQAGD